MAKREEKNLKRGWFPGKSSQLSFLASPVMYSKSVYQVATKEIEPASSSLQNKHQVGHHFYQLRAPNTSKKKKAKNPWSPSSPFPLDLVCMTTLCMQKGPNEMSLYNASLVVSRQCHLTTPPLSELWGALQVRVGFILKRAWGSCGI